MTIHDISLKVKNTPSDGTDNYTNVIASDGTVYSYQFSEVDSHGTTHYGGNVTFYLSNASDDKVKVDLDNPGPGKPYEIDYVDFADDVNQQLSWREEGSRYQAVIHNKGKKVANVYYLVVVLDRSKDYCTVPCDPMINNK